MATEIVNAKITDVSITMADHGCLTYWLSLEGGVWGCGYGGYCIGKGYLGSENFSAENGWGLEAMMHIMNVVGVHKWEDLKGKYCRVEKGRLCDPIDKIGNITEDKWFDQREFFEAKRSN